MNNNDFASTEINIKDDYPINKKSLYDLAADNNKKLNEIKNELNELDHNLIGFYNESIGYDANEKEINSVKEYEFDSSELIKNILSELNIIQKSVKEKE